MISNHIQDLLNAYNKALGVMVSPPTKPNVGPAYLHTYGTYTHDDGSTDNIYVSQYYAASDTYEVQLLYSRHKLLRFGVDMQLRYVLHPDQAAAAKAWHNGLPQVASPPQALVGGGSILFEKVEPFEFVPMRWDSPKKCECGSDKVNAPAHSSYCPKYTK